jgi:hypothetical protein
MSRRRTVTSLFAVILLLSAAIFQDFRSGAKGLETQSDIPQTAIAGFFTTKEAVVAPALTITPITWGLVGLDSNNVTTGPNLFPVGARVCNTGSNPATNVASTFVWDSANALINVRAGSVSSLSLPTLAVGACADFYYEIEVTRSAAAYNTTRAFHITATADTLGVISTPSSLEIYVEKLVSQNRNSVTQIKLNGANVPFGGTMNLVVGNTYTIELVASTATNGYEQIESFINLPNVIFQTLSVSSTYTAPSGYTGDKLYEDACGWDPVTTSPTYRSCVGPANPAGDKAGGNVTLTYTVKILSGAGTSRTLNTLIYDFSGSSYHYNNDFSSTFVIARIFLPPTAANVSVDGRVMLEAGNGVRNATVILTEANGTQRTAVTGSFGYYRFDEIEAGQTVVVSIRSKRFTFNPSSRIVSLTDSVADLDFIAQE